MKRKIKRKVKRYGKKARRLAKRIYQYYFYIFYLPRFYRRAAQAPVVKNKVIFLSNRKDVFSDNYALIAKRLKRTNRYKIKVLGLGIGVTRFKTQIELAKKAAAEIATAAYVFTDDSNKLMGCLPLRKETTLTNVWHACGAFKCFGTFTIDKKFGGGATWWKTYHPYKYINLLTVSSPEVVWAYRDSTGIKLHEDCVQPLGISRTDVFYSDSYREKAMRAVHEAVPQSEGKKIILYAPTFRGRATGAKAPKALDIAAFKEAFGGEYVLLIKHHPFVKKLPRIPEELSDFAFDVTREPKLEINQLLCTADVCITDYSSVVFEYSLLERPILFFAYDKADYDDWRGFFYDYEEMTPGPVCTDNESMIEYIRDLPGSFELARIRSFREKFMSACDGHATDRIMKAVFGDTMTAKLSIIIPAYNAMPELTRALDTIKDQVEGREDVRVIVVDDGSTDGTGAEADRYAKEMPFIFKAIHLGKPSGSPSKPRNVGIEAALSKYVLFHDAGDYLGDEAVARILRRIRKWDPDVMLVKFKGEDGRTVPVSMFKTSEEEIDPLSSSVMYTMSPLKVIRRSFIDKNHLSFPEDCMPEDIPFALAAYTYADKVSVAADYDYYHVTARDDGEHATLTTWDDLDSNFKVFEGVLDFIDKNVDASKRNITLMPRLFNRDVKNMLISAVENHEGDERISYISRIIGMFAPYWDEEILSTMPPEKSMILEAAFGENGSPKAVEALVSSAENPLDSCYFDTDADGHLLCSFDCHDVHLRLDVTDTTPMQVIPTSIVNAPSSIDFAGEFRILEQVPRYFEDMRFSLVIKTLDHEHELCAPASFELMCTADDRAYYAQNRLVRDWSAREFSWKAELPKDYFGKLDIQPDDPEKKVKLVLFFRVQCGSFSRDIRVGSRATDEARQEWLGSRFEADGVKWLPYCTKLDNFSWRHDEEA